MAKSLYQKILEADSTAGSFDENDQAASLLQSMVPDLKFSLIKYTQEAFEIWSTYREKLAVFKNDKRLKRAPAPPYRAALYPDVELVMPLVLKKPTVVYKSTNAEVEDDDIQPI